MVVKAQYGKRGAPKGCAPRNPAGKNQWEGERAKKPFTFRLPVWLDEEIRQYAEAEGMGLTQFWEQLAKEWSEKQKAKT